MMRLKIFFLFLFFLSKTQFAQQLVINEVSQGPTGAKEYVELLVVGTPTCNAIPCMDLRNYIIDDNNGNHATGAGVGIAAGCVRLQNIPFWQCIPYGTIIVFYNDADQNASIPAQDLSMLDGNCRLVIPISNCTLLERHTTLPSTTLPAYPTTGFVGCGNWTQISMANGDDSFQTINAAGALVHSVSWNNNNLATIIYFPGAAGGNVAIMTNALNNNPANQANWVMSPVAGNETPGSPNNAANSAWISSMNNGCLPLLPLTTTVSSTNAGCSCNGSATVVASGAIGPYTYTWFPSGGNTTTASGLCAGIYTVSVTSSNGCVDTKTVNIVSAGSVSVTTAITNITCNGFANGSATATPSGGTGPYTYTWSPSGGNGVSASGLTAGNYTVLVKDVNNCTVTATALITQPATALTAITSATNILCFGAANGSASVTASGGTAGYTYTWSPTGGNTTLASPLTPGNYTVLVKDANNCTVTATALITQPATALSALTSATNILCFGSANGSASVTALGGTAGYTYTWSPASGNTTLASLLTAGNYTVLVKDANNCTVTATALITQPATSLTAVTSATNILCFGAANGSASVTASGGTAGYTYTWSPSGGNATLASPLTAGNYTVLVKDANNCTVIATALITQPATALSALTSATNILCFGAANGSASVTASGGTSGYTYTWSPSGGNTTLASPLTAGNYTVLVKDANNCTVTATALITQPATALSALTSATNILCFGAANGLASVMASGGTAGYTYTWSPSGGNTTLASPLTAGNYTVLVQDANNCTITATALITQPASAITAITSATNILCFGSANGSASVTASGGTAGYTYTWSPSGGNTTLASPLTAGNYTVLVKDANNCTVTATAFITQPVTALSALTSATNILCFGAANGSALVTASGGTAGYTYTWSPSGGNTTLASPLTPGNYSVLVADANNCTVTATAIITQPATALASTITFTNATCGMSNGSASVNPTGGTAGYAFVWSPSGGTAAFATNLSSGNYSVVITDANNCQITETVTIIQPNSMVFTVTTTSVSCNSGSNGTATINVSGGNSPYSYTWSPVPGGGQGTSIVTGLSAQIYSVIVADNLGCTTLTTAIITQPAIALAATPSVTNVLCFGGSNGTASITASGGTPGYTYTWSPVISNTSLISSLNAGSYTVLVMDANSCTISIAANVSQPVTPLTTVLSATDVLCFGNNDGSAGVVANGGTPGYTYNWIPTGGTNSVANNLAPGNYTVVVKDINNCTVNTFTSISQPTAALGASVISSNVKCNGATNGSATITASGGTAGYTFTWLPSLVSSSLNVGLSAGTHTAFIVDANSCTFSLSTTINQPTPITLNVNPIKLCSGQNGVLLGNVNGGTAPYSYTWNNVPGSFSVAVSTTANVIYTLSVTDANGCNSPIDTAMINVSTPLTLSISPTKTICSGTSSALSVNANGGSGTYQYNWLPSNIPGQLISVNLNNTTVYTVTVIDGCSQPAIATTTVFVETVPSPTLLANKYSGCSPVCVSFTNTAFNPTLSIQNSLWTFSDGSFANGQQPNHCFTDQGAFTAINSFTTASGCKMTFELKNQINVFQKPDADFTANTYLFDNSNPAVNFYNNSANAINYFWDFGSGGTSTLVNPIYNFNEPGKYLVTLIAMNGFCSDTAYKTVECLPDFTFYAPNTFTPNNDKRNDFFYPLGEGWDVKTYNLMIFDRWGEKIYATNQYDAWWDGTYKGEVVKEDTYIWKVNLKDIFGKPHNYVGHITVVR
jgi:gliding motility-associated-like protein